MRLLKQLQRRHRGNTSEFGAQALISEPVHVGVCNIRWDIFWKYGQGWWQVGML
jgi:hypothetical protein